MPEINLNDQAELLRTLLAADAVLYWRKENASLALPVGVAPPGLVDAGFLPPACGEGLCLRHGAAARALLPLRMRTRLDPEGGIVLAGGDRDQGGILAAWYSSVTKPACQAEAIMAFALAAARSQLDLALAHHEMQRSWARRLSGMADALPLGVIVVPAGNRPGYVNHMAAALLDLPHGTTEADRLAGKLSELAGRASNRDEMLAKVESFVASNGSAALAGQVWRFPASPGALRVTVAPIDPGQSAGWFWLLEDVSAAEAEAEARERQRHLEWLNAELEQRVAERTAELEQTNAELEHFAYAMAHDLQTPLRSISGFAQLVQRAARRYGDTEIDDWCVQVINNAKRLQDLIQGLLAYTRVDSRAAAVESVAMNALFDEVVASLQAAIGETGAEVRRGDLPAVYGVRTQLGQLLQNLVENGIKYNQSQPPRVTVSCSQGNGEWVFSVADNGMGIDPKYHEQVFGMFKRLHGYGQIPGTGIGLALCRRIVERHQGRIWVESQPGQGATFRFTLPVERQADITA